MQKPDINCPHCLGVGSFGGALFGGKRACYCMVGTACQDCEGKGWIGKIICPNCDGWGKEPVRKGLKRPQFGPERYSMPPKSYF